MTLLITWGKHPSYANGEWIKLFSGTGKAATQERLAQGFKLRVMPYKKHPENAAPSANNPYPTHTGYGLRVHRAKTAIETLGRNPYADIFSRGFDSCFENDDGDAVVWALMHHAHHEKPDKHGEYLLTQGIQTMFSRTLNGQKYPQCWLDIYHGKPLCGEPLPVQPSLF